MLLTHKVKLLPTEEQKAALPETMERFNEACGLAAAAAFRIRSANKMRLQKEVHYALREKFGLPAQLAIRAIAKTCEAYKLDKSVRPRFDKHGAVVYGQRILSWKGIDRASLVTVHGRTLMPYLSCDHYRSGGGIVRGRADLVLKDGIFYLCVAVEVPEADEIKPVDALGVDLGIVNLAVDSDGEVHSGEAVSKVRGKRSKLRSDLQSCGTRSAKRHLKQPSGKEHRFQTDTNHCIPKHIVAKAEDTKRAIAIEDLEGIRSRVRCGFAGPADHVAAMNIAAGGRVNGPIVTGDLSSHVGLLQSQAPRVSGG